MLIDDELLSCRQFYKLLLVFSSFGIQTLERVSEVLLLRVVKGKRLLIELLEA